ncbi:MAG: hypothetical protein KDH09_16570 [Chrysiogenetes bacterium]|nr:hypothetical protein [Chrysiogenetes bacterium]
MDYWVGRSVDQLQRDEGLPKVVMAFPDGTKAYRYWGAYQQQGVDSENSMRVLCVSEKLDIWDGCAAKYMDSDAYHLWRKGRLPSDSDYEVEDHRTYYVDVSGRIVGWLFKEKAAGRSPSYKYGPKTEEGFALIKGYLSRERAWLEGQGKPDPERPPRGKLRPDIFDYDTQPIEEEESSPVSDFVAEDVPGGLYSAGKGVRNTLRAIVPGTQPDSGEENKSSDAELTEP